MKRQYNTNFLKEKSNGVAHGHGTLIGGFTSRTDNFVN